jgi:hypothetical protein
MTAIIAAAGHRGERVLLLGRDAAPDDGPCPCHDAVSAAYEQLLDLAGQHAQLQDLRAAVKPAAASRPAGFLSRLFGRWRPPAANPDPDDQAAELERELTLVMDKWRQTVGALPAGGRPPPSPPPAIPGARMGTPTRPSAIAGMVENRANSSPSGPRIKSATVPRSICWSWPTRMESRKANY